MRAAWTCASSLALLGWTNLARAQGAPPPAAPPPAPAEERTAKNAVYAEGLGAGLIWSVNYDRAFGDFSARIGFGYTSVTASASSSGETSTASAAILAVPITASYLGIGSKKHMLELGAGLSIMQFGAGASIGSTSSTEEATAVYGVGIIGYRLQPAHGGFMFRVGFTPIFGQFGSIPYWPHLSLGGTF